MSLLEVPRDADLWPTLGGGVCAFIERHFRRGPGDLRGEPVVLSDDWRRVIYRAYEVHPQTGRRRFQRVSVALPKGCAKTEHAALIAAAEMCREAPVRFSHWGADGEPVGRGIPDPAIFMLTITEEQTAALCYGALVTILEESDLADEFTITQGRVTRRDGTGRCEPVASSPSSLEGARTTLNVFDEMSYMTTPRLRESHRRMLANAPKRKAGDCWSLGCTLGFTPGEESVAEGELAYAEAVARGEIEDASFCYVRRWAGASHDLKASEGREAAVAEARGPDASSWVDVQRIADQLDDPDADEADFERVWLNRVTASSAMAFDMNAVHRCVRPDIGVRRNEQIVLGFDGSRKHDGTALVACTLGGHLVKAAIWERSAADPASWVVPDGEVDELVDVLFRRYKVVKALCDPWLWQGRIDEWSKRHGRDCVQVFDTTKALPTAVAVRRLSEAFKQGTVTWDGNEDLKRHFANARKRNLQQRDEDGQRLYALQKERPDLLIDAAMAAVLAWEARRVALPKTKIRGDGPTVSFGHREMARY